MGDATLVRSERWTDPNRRSSRDTGCVRWSELSVVAVLMVRGGTALAALVQPPLKDHGNLRYELYAEVEGLHAHRKNWLDTASLEG